MTIVELSNKERKLLEEIAKSTTDAAQLRRTQAITDGSREFERKFEI